MTPANPDALADALVDQIARILDLDAHHLGRPDYYGPELILALASARVRVARKTAGAIIAGPLAPILAAKEAAEARAAQLQAEVEALREALKPFSAGGKWGVWTAWIVNGAPDREQGKAAAKQIVQWRAAVDVALSPQPTAGTANPASDAPWPSGCIKPNACARHRQCVYAMSAEKCRHFGQGLGPAIEAAEAARAATAREGQADA
ncbi:hypothetical protein [Methylobacterium sp. B4]|uniref:hypothetical protein n=1 Tax=Methylobacterium sp. B4 TaxID=1938755 RepID=UPI000D756F95|nr:hypothetical protein [Methylobacterium sp. B4]PXW55593.1 hypothetical protein BY998_11877 [Methylobacterium sp. B4]